MEYPSKDPSKILEYIRIVGFWDFPENPDIKNPPPNTLRLYARDNGLGKSQLVVRDSNGALSVLWTQP